MKRVNQTIALNRTVARQIWEIMSMLSAHQANGRRFMCHISTDKQTVENQVARLSTGKS